MPVRTASVERERASNVVSIIHGCVHRQQYVRRACIAPRVGSPPMATSIHDSIRRATRAATRRVSAASTPPRPSSPTFRPTCASTSVDASATAGMLVARSVQPLLRFRRAWATPIDAPKARSLSARSAPKHFHQVSPPDAVKRSGEKKATTSTSRFSRLCRLGRSVPAAAWMTTAATSSGAYFLPVRRPQSPTSPRKTRPIVEGCQKAALRRASSNHLISIRRATPRPEERAPTPRRARRRCQCVLPPVCPDNRLAVDVLATVAISVAREKRSSPHLR